MSPRGQPVFSSRRINCDNSVSSRQAKCSDQLLVMPAARSTSQSHSAAVWGHDPKCSASLCISVISPPLSQAAQWAAALDHRQSSAHSTGSVGVCVTGNCSLIATKRTRSPSGGYSLHVIPMESMNCITDWPATAGGVGSPVSFFEDGLPGAPRSTFKAGWVRPDRVATLSPPFLSNL